MPSLWPADLVPIVLGFVGHRLIPDEDHQALLEKLEAIFTQFKGAYPQSPIVLLTSLAQGGDLLAVQAAERQRVAVRIALPMPADDFLASTSFDADAPGTKDRGRAADYLRNESMETFVVPLPKDLEPTDQAHWRAIATEKGCQKLKEHRHKIYANTSGYIVRHCQVLIALWDDQPGKPAGTAETVAFKLHAQRPRLYEGTDPLSARSDAGPVITILTRRSRSDHMPAVGMTELRLPGTSVTIPWEKVRLAVKPWEQLLYRLLLAWGEGSRSNATAVHALAQPAQLAAQLNHPTTVLARRIRDGFRPATCAALDLWDATTPLPDGLAQSLLEDLNAVISGPSLWRADLFMGINLREGVRHLAEKGPIGHEIPVLNRGLIEDAFQVGLEDRHAAAIPAVFEWDRRSRRRRELDGLRAHCHNINTFNRCVLEAGEIRQPGQTWRQIESNGLAPVDRETRSRIERMCQLRDRASRFSQQLDKHLTELHSRLFLVLFISAVFYHIYSHLPDTSTQPAAHRPLWLLLFLGGLTCAVGIIARVWYQGFDTRRLDYRALAEALRVRLYLALAGCGSSVADSYLNQTRGPMAWPRRALQAIAPHPRFWGQQFHRHSLPDQERILRVINLVWVEGQRRYFHDARHKHHAQATGFRRAAFLFVIAGWLLAAFLLAGVTLPSFLHRSPHEPHSVHGTASMSPDAGDAPGAATHPDHGVLFLSALCIAAGAFLAGWCDRRSLEDLAMHYDRMEGVFEHGRRELDDAVANRDIEKAQKVVETLGAEATAEHAQWLILRRARPLELHLG